MMLRKLSVLVLLTLAMSVSSCTMISRLNEAIDKFQALADKSELSTAKIDQGLQGVESAAAALGDKGRVVADAVHDVREVIASADTNKDQKISGIAEWKLLLGGLVTWLLAWLKSFATEKKLAAKISVAKRDLWGAVSELRDDRSSNGGPN